MFTCPAILGSRISAVASFLGFAFATACAPGEVGKDLDLDEAIDSEHALSHGFDLEVGAERHAFRSAWKKGGDPGNWQRASFNMGNAYWLSRYAELAYERSEASMRAALEAEGAKPQAVWLLENACTGAAAFYVKMPDHGVIAFRGTELGSGVDIADIFSDLSVFKRVWRGPGLVHFGFHAQYDSLVSATCASANIELMDFLDQLHGPGTNNGPLYVTGHSLGAALATMLVADAQTATCAKTAGCRKAPSLDIAALYTFGAPKVGNTQFANEVAWRATGHTPIYRMVHGNDIVTTVPRNISLADTLENGDYEHLSYPNGSEATLQVWFAGEQLTIAKAVLHDLDIDHWVGGYVADLETHAASAGAL